MTSYILNGVIDKYATHKSVCALPLTFNSLFLKRQIVHFEQTVKQMSASQYRQISIISAFKDAGCNFCDKSRLLISDVHTAHLDTFRAVVSFVAEIEMSALVIRLSSPSPGFL